MLNREAMIKEKNLSFVVVANWKRIISTHKISMFLKGSYALLKL